MSAINYSQNNLLKKTLKSKRHDSRTRRLQIYAVLTGFLSMLITLGMLIVRIVKP